MFLTQSAPLSQAWRLLYIGFAAATAILLDILYFDVGRGAFGFFLFTLYYLIAFLAITFVTKQIHRVRMLGLLVPLLLLSASTALYENEVVTELIPWIVLLLLLFFSVLLTLRDTHKHTFSFLGVPLFKNMDLPFGKLGEILRDLIPTKKETSRERMRHALIGVLIAVPILLIFLSLFSSADAVFASQLKYLFDIDLKADTLWRIFRAIVLTFLLGGISYVIFDPKHDLMEFKAKLGNIPPTIAMTLFLLVNLLFAAFVLIQLQYLFGAQAYVIDQGITYAEYARSGFFEMVWVMALSTLLLLFFYRSTRQEGNAYFLKILKVILVFQVAVIAFSALKRMNVYQEAYGYTVLRLYVEWFIYMGVSLLIGLATAIISRRPFQHVLYGILLLATVSLTLVSMINVDRIIANKNIERFVTEDKKLDIIYLGHLSPDVVTAFDFLFDNTQVQRLTVAQIRDIQHVLEQHHKDITDRRWKETTWSTKKANDFFERLKSEDGKAYREKLSAIVN